MTASGYLFGICQHFIIVLSKQDRQCNDEMLEDTKGISRSRQSKQDRQYNDEMLEDTKGISRNRVYPFVIF
jgi:hypothetical protein